VDDLHQAIFGHSLTTYGVIWLIVGVVLIAAGLLILTPTTRAAQISRWIGIVGAGIAAITAVTWLPYYPVWSLVYIGIAVLVVYGLSTHFDEEPVTS
jgi:sulfite exporter TauE/SafE